jgi:hypothetical protein
MLTLHVNSFCGMVYIGTRRDILSLAEIVLWFPGTPTPKMIVFAECLPQRMNDAD